VRGSWGAWVMGRSVRSGPTEHEQVDAGVRVEHHPLLFESRALDEFERVTGAPHADFASGIDDSVPRYVVVVGYGCEGVPYLSSVPRPAG